MTDIAFAKQFAADWISSWNDHDIEKVLEFYSDDFVIESPLALKLFPESSGIISGKNNVREYWVAGLKHNPELKFELLDVLTGVNGLTIYFLSITQNRRVVEVLRFNKEGKINKAIVNHSSLAS
ncbi:MAG: nuclear transport factor 2 family protein [Bacteroidota bacterium]|nr:nuclear transport factor 2 family protein [Bacteroidota bacterium]